MGSEKRHIKILMFPWLAHGHISLFLELAKRLSLRNFHIHLCSSPVNLTSIKNKIPEKFLQSVQLVELHLPSSPELPSNSHTTNGLPLHLHSNLRKALKMAKNDFINLLTDLQPELVIYDIILPWVGIAASGLNIPAVPFFTSGAAMCSYFSHLRRYPGVEFPFPEIRLSKFEHSLACKNMESLLDDVREPDDEYHTNDIMLMNTTREMEGKYVDYLSESTHTKILTVGALVQEPNFGGDDDGELIEWLEKKDKLSTVFVSFGSEYFLKKEDAEEIAYGLELSNTNFIWIIRFPKGEKIGVEEVLPTGYVERVGARGKVIEKWAPQAKILNHPSVGGFVSHCGWNSVMEAIEFCVPVIAMPMHLDQPMIAKLVVELGVGVEVERDDKGNIQREEISKVIKDVVMGKVTGNVLQSELGELRESIRLKSKEEIGVAEMLREVSGKNVQD